MGTGVDVEVVRQIQRMSRGTGALVYMQGLVRALIRYHPLSLKIEADGDDVSGRVMMVAVANGRCVGGMFRITPRAEPDDAQLDLCIVDEMPLLAQLAIVPRIIAGTHESSSRVRSRTVRAVSIGLDGGGPLFFQLDGELRAGRLPPQGTPPADGRLGDRVGELVERERDRAEGERDDHAGGDVLAGRPGGHRPTRRVRVHAGQAHQGLKEFYDRARFGHANQTFAKTAASGQSGTLRCAPHSDPIVVFTSGVLG